MNDRVVYCRLYKEELPGLTHPPLPGKKGEEIFKNVSAKAWKEWMTHQTLLINEKQLNLIAPESRQYLSTQMENFFSGRAVDKAEGFVPKS